MDNEGYQERGDPDKETRARDLLLEEGVLVIHTDCPLCGARPVRPIRREKYWCSRCRHEWGLRKGSILEGTRIPYSVFISILHQYAEDLPANSAAIRLGIAYNTVYEIYRRIGSLLIYNTWTSVPSDTGPGRSATTCPARQGPGKRKSDRFPHLYGIRLSGDLIQLDTVQRYDPQMILSIPVPKVRRGNLLFIDRFGRRYAGFIAFIPDGTQDGAELTMLRDDLPWSPLAGFWVFAGRKWTNHKGITRERFPEFAHELAFRYNHRSSDLFAAILVRIARAQPVRTSGGAIDHPQDAS